MKGQGSDPSDISVGEPAIVLRTAPYRDNDLVVTLLTKNQGKLAAIARGARNSKKRFAGGIEVFDCANFEISPARNNRLAALTGRSRYHPWTGLRENYERFVAASLCVEVVDHMSIEGDPEGSSLFAPLFHALAKIEGSSSRVESSAVAVYLVLNALIRGGFDPLEDDIQIDADERLWLSEMASGRLTIPADEKRPRAALALLLSRVEALTGKRLSSRGHLAGT